ncbi:Sepiapterin reductase [Fasciolopsis buskii]|uniref:Sepiapterin reductase n=1 Tax=Fasciolopsis buskii TaxID=27845 RepID=A0A8E0VLZ4_9TREM|nr:Sepiapterin reductase [Fasciolopsis buski]
MAPMEKCTCAENSAVDALWKGSHCHIVVTGASRGFGRALCLQLVEQLTNGNDQPASIKMLLMGRDMQALKITEAQMMERRNIQSNTELAVVIGQPLLDMAEATESSLMSVLQPFFDLTSKTSHGEKHWNLLVHNAATLGCLKKRADERLSMLEQDTYYRVNLTAPMVLTSLFLQHFAPFNVAHHPTMVLNISSLAAVQPFPHMSDYCTGKAARQMYLQNLAVDRPSVAVFNYSPGPLNTDMYTQLAQDHGDENSRIQAAENKRSGRIVAPEASARVCVLWLRRLYISGEPKYQPKALVCRAHESGWADIWQGRRLDYYDAVEMEKR